MQNPFRDFDLTRTEKRAAAERIAAARGIKLPSAYAAIRRLTKSTRTTIDRRSKDVAREVKAVVNKERNKAANRAPVVVVGQRNKSGYIFYYVSDDEDVEGIPVILVDVTLDSRQDALDLAESYAHGFKRREIEDSGYMNIWSVTVKYRAPRVGRQIIEKKRGNKKDRDLINAGYELVVTVLLQQSDAQGTNNETPADEKTSK